MSKLYIHHGYNKTGTTALQNFFRANRVALISKGVLYPTYGTEDIAAHHRLIGHFSRRPPDHFLEHRELDDVINDLMAELTATSVDTMLISTEGMVFYKDFYPERIARFLQRFDEVYLISYLRRQDEYAYSYYNSAVRNGRCATGFAEFIAGINLDYDDNLAAWATLFGAQNIIVRPYDSKRFVGGNIHADFLHILGLELSPDLLVSAERPNAALSKPMVYMLAELNRFGVRNHQQFLGQLRQYLGSVEGLREAPEYFSRTDRLEMIERYRESNQRVAQKYCAAEPLFDETLRSDIGEVGSYDDQVRQLYAGLVVKLWNDLAVAPLQERPGLLTRVGNKVRLMLRGSR